MAAEREKTITHIDAALERVLAEAQEATAWSPEQVARWEAQQQHRDRRDRLDASGIIERLDEGGAPAIIDDTPMDTRALRLVRTWLMSSRPALVLLGDPGQGKTVAAAWALARMPGRYITAQSLCELHPLSKNWREKSRWYQHLRTELLVIDELNRETDATIATVCLQDVIDVRQRAPRRTLLLGNITLADFVKRYDGRTLDRLGVDSDHAGIAIVRELKGKSMRKEPRSAVG